MSTALNCGVWSKDIHCNSSYEKQLPVRLIRPPKQPEPSAEPGLTSVTAATELCFGCRRHLPRTAFPLSSGAVVGRCLSCARLDNAARSGFDLTAFKVMMERIKAAEEEKENTSSPAFQMQVRISDSDSAGVLPWLESVTLLLDATQWWVLSLDPAQWVMNWIGEKSSQGLRTEHHLYTSLHQ